jgi:hypothetical protein
MLLLVGQKLVCRDENTFKKLIVRTVDHALRNVLVHEEEKGEGEPQQHPGHNHLDEVQCNKY